MALEAPPTTEGEVEGEELSVIDRLVDASLPLGIVSIA